MFGLFRKNRPAGQDAPEQDGPEPLARPGKMTQGDERQVYSHNPSVVDYLPWAEFLDEDQCLLLDDGVSVGAVYDITPVATEGRPDTRLEQIRDVVEDALQDSFDDIEANPWIVQFFCQDENDVDAYLDRLRGYVKPHAQHTDFTEAWLKETESHLRGIARPQGLFVDKLITGQPWRGQQRRTRMVVYRWVEKNNRDVMPPVGMLNQACERLSGALSSVNIGCTRQNGLQVHAWLLRLFNPAPEGMDREQFYRAAAYEDNALLAPYMTKVVKMWRKLGAWLWLATQNLEDYPAAAGKMLNMAEWWICLTMPKKEVEDIARFRTLSEEQKSVLLSASKLSGCYTEGVVLSKKIEALFRAVPPSLFLALGMTEKEEKAERKALMRKHNCSELDAAILVARKLDRLRGLMTAESAGMPEYNDKREKLTA